MQLTPEEADKVFADIVNLVQRGDRDNALQLATKVLELGLDEPLILLLAAESYEQQGRPAEGITLLHQATTIAPEEAQVWYCLGTMQIRQGQNECGLLSLDTALKLQPDLIPALTTAAKVSYRMGQLSRSQTYYQKITDLCADNTESYAALAAIAARRNKLIEARNMAEQAIKIQSNNFTAQMTLGRVELQEGNVQQTCERMNRLLNMPQINQDQKIAIYDLRAEALDKRNSTDAAFADYRCRNTLLIDKFTPRIRVNGAESETEKARRLATLIPDIISSSSVNFMPQYDANIQHVFLLSFPRSGTTLLEKVLRSHSKAVTLEEVDHLGEIGHRWLTDSTELTSLTQLTEQQILQFRNDYWQRVRDSLNVQLKDKTLIDKLPLHTLSLPVIARLFPDAKILFALRDPRDVVLSCFRRRFQINSAMFELLDLHRAAGFYHEVMNLAQVCRTLLPLRVLEVRHEDVVLDFISTIKSVIDFVGLDWEPELSQFSQQLHDDPRTPSDIQLKRGLNTDGLAQWRRYEQHLQPILPTLEPWIQRFGYTNVD